MMPGVNLLPWRQRRRQRRRNVFAGQLLATTLSAAALIGTAEFVLQDRIDGRKQSQLAAREQIGRLDQRIAELDVQRRSHDDLAARSLPLRRLWRQRAAAVGILDALARGLVAGAHYTEVSKHGDVLSIQGIAAGNDRVSQLMGNLDGSPWFDEPQLKRIGSAPEAIYGSRSAAFEIAVAVTNPNQQEAARGAATQ